VSDTYKGESLQKKAARFETHRANQEWLDRHYPDCFDRGLHVFLASREGGDIGVLKQLGAPLRNLVGIDRDLDAIKACAAKWCRGDGSEEPELVHAEDAGNQLAWIRNCLEKAKGLPAPNDCGDAECWIERWGRESGYPYITSVFWDFCAHLDKSTIDMFTDTWRRLSYGSVLSVAVLKGREKQQSTHRALQAPLANRKRRRSWRSIHPPSYSVMAEMMSGAREWDVSGVLEMIEQETGDINRTGARWLLMQQALWLVDDKSEPAPILVLEYQSSTTTSHGVPMLICSFAKTRLSLGRRPAPPPKIVRLNNGDALAWRNQVLQNVDVDAAADLLNVPRLTAVAWKAHATRGTYARTG
jgi:hypothetical protein